MVKQIGLNLRNNLKGVSCAISYTYLGIRNSIVHYGCQYILFEKNKLNLPHKGNKIAVTLYHVAYDDTYLGLIPQAVKFVDLWHTTCKLTKEKMLRLGIPDNKIVLIPLGITLKNFPRLDNAARENIKSRLRLPKNRFIIGSFQKDGVGWGKGLEPKLIKGPDIFCDAVERLAKKYDIFVLLTGPSRGYVRRRLDKAHIPYSHHYLMSSDDISIYYQAIDLYLVTSRGEGGPLAVLESLASGVPLIATRVGMAADVINDGENGFLVDIEQTDQIIANAARLIEDRDLRDKIIFNGLEDSRLYDSENIAKEYKEKIFQRLSRP